jgi:hypothetical protein
LHKFKRRLYNNTILHSAGSKVDIKALVEVYRLITLSQGSFNDISMAAYAVVFGLAHTYGSVLLNSDDTFPYGLSHSQDQSFRKLRRRSQLIQSNPDYARTGCRFKIIDPIS